MSKRNVWSHLIQPWLNTGGKCIKIYATLLGTMEGGETRVHECQIHHAPLPLMS